MQNSLRKSEQFNRTVLEHSPDCIKILDREGRLQFMNRNGLCLLQIDDSAPIKERLWWDLWPEETQATVRKSLETAIRGESARFQAFCSTAKGDPKWWDVIVVGVPIHSEPPERVIAVSRDVTEHKHHEETMQQWKNELEVRVHSRTQELEATQERLVALSSQLSVTEQQERRKLARDLHDYLAQILAVGQMKTKLALKQSGLPTATRSVIEDIEKMFQQGLTYTRTLIAELSPPKLHESGLSQALRWLRERFHKDRLQVEVHANCEQVSLSEEQSVIVFQAVRELLFNVLKHAEVDRATVDLKLDEEGLLQIAVSDQGRGLSADGDRTFVSRRGAYETGHAFGRRRDIAIQRMRRRRTYCHDNENLRPDVKAVKILCPHMPR